MANYTPNYQLHQWEPEDSFLRTDFNEDLKKIDTALMSKGNCRIVTGSYTGNGTFGSASPCRLEFDAQPLLIIITGRGMELTAVFPSTHGMILRQIYEVSAAPLIWDDYTLSWTGSTAELQMNYNNIKYNYITLIKETA